MKPIPLLAAAAMMAASASVAAAQDAQSDATNPELAEADAAAEAEAEAAQDPDEMQDEVVARGVRLEPVYFERYKPVPLEYQGPGFRQGGEVERASTNVNGARIGLVANYGAEASDASPSDPMSALDEDLSAVRITVQPATDD